MRIAETDSSLQLRVIETDPQTDPRWLRFVSAHPNGSVYHHPSWLKALQKEYGQRGVYLGCEDANGQLMAILPLLYTRGLPFNLGGPQSKRRLSSLPRTPTAGPLSNHPQATTAILQAAVSLVRQNAGVQLQIKTRGPELKEMVQGLISMPWRYSYLLQLPPSSEGQFRIDNNKERAKIKWAINKATRVGIHVRRAETEADLREWYTLYLDTLRRNAFPPRPYRFFLSLWELLRPQSMLELLLAEQKEIDRNRIIGGCIFLMFGKTVSYAFNGARLADFSLRPNDLILWQAINEACRKGAQDFDLGEVPDGHEGLARFKSKWGAQRIRLHRYYFPAPGASNDDITGLRKRYRSLVENVWSRLPLSVTAWLGDWIFSYL
jgi:hypothetical protein